MSGGKFSGKRKIADIQSSFPEVGGVYLGRVISVQRVSCFVRLFGFDEKAGGFLLATDIGDYALTDLRPTTRMYVKVLSISRRNFLTLTLERIDPITGQDFKLSKRPSLDPETIRIKMAALPNFFIKRVEKDGTVPRQIQDLVDLDVMLYCLGLIDEEMNLTDFGKQIPNYPVAQHLWRILMAGVQFQCSHEVLTIVSKIVAKCDIFQMFQRAKTKADVERITGRFSHPAGDYLTFLAAFEAFEENGSSRTWCSDNLVDFDSLQRIKFWRGKILEAMNRMGISSIVRAGKGSPMIRQALASTMFYRSARWDPIKCCYRTLANENRMIHVHFFSVILCYQRPPEYIIYGDISMDDDSNEEWIIDITAIESDWLLQLAPQWFTLPGSSSSVARDPEDAQPLPGSSSSVARDPEDALSRTSSPN